MNISLVRFRINYSTSNVNIPSEYTLSDFDKVREYNNILSWSKISRVCEMEYDENIDSTELSEEFMLEFKNYLNWDEVCTGQNFSYEFIKNNHNLLNMVIISRKL